MAERVTRKQPNIPDGVKSVRPARLERRAEMAENPYTEQARSPSKTWQDRIITERFLAFNEGCERQHPISTALERKRIVAWLRQHLQYSSAMKGMVLSLEDWQAFKEGKV